MRTKANPSKMRVVKPPADLPFVDHARSSQSVYYVKLSEALRADCCIEVSSDDTYVKQQFRQQAKKMGVSLVYAQKDGNTYIKPIQLSAQERRLLLLLREPKTVASLQPANLELALIQTLQTFTKRGAVRVRGDQYSITEFGLELLKEK